MLKLELGARLCTHIGLLIHVTILAAKLVNHGVGYSLRAFGQLMLEPIGDLLRFVVRGRFPRIPNQFGNTQLVKLSQ